MESEVQEKAATELTPELKQAYVDVIDLLFNGVLKAQLDQINEQVVVDIDTMMVEIAKCSQKMAEFGFDIVYKLTLGTAIGKIVDGFIQSKGSSAAVKSTLKKWVMELASHRQFAPCLNGARVNWKSRIELDLLDI